MPKIYFSLYNGLIMNSKLIIISIIALVGFVVLAYFATNKPQPTSFPEVAQVRTKESTGSAQLADHTMGKGKHILVEYSDLQCPACKSFHDYLANEKKKDAAFAKVLNDQYTVVFRHFPLVSIHKNAEPAAKAAEAAGMQNKFFEFIDKAFASQQEWSVLEDPQKYFISIANDLGLDVDQFASDMKTKQVTKKIQSDVDSALRTNLDSTPTFFIDGEKVVNLGNFEDLKKRIIDSANNKK